MKRGAELKRTGFGRSSQAGAANLYQADREQRLAGRAARTMAAVVPRASAMASAAESSAPMPKEMPVRSEPYRRAVASFPCLSCGVPGISQCAHANTGKGMGTKACDLRSFPLCACQPGRQGCHARFDQGALFPKLARQAIEEAWIADTQRRILAMGLWPHAKAPAPTAGMNKT